VPSGRALALVLGTLALTGCGGGRESAADPVTAHDAGVPERLVDAPRAWYPQATWLAPDRFVVTVGPAEEAEVPMREPLRVMRADGSGLRPLEPDRDVGDCRQVVDDLPEVLPDGRLGFRETCDFEDVARPFRTRLYAWDVDGGDPEVLLETEEALGGFTFARGLRDGFYAVDSSVCAGMGTIRDGVLGPLPVRLGGAAWTLDASLRGGECVEEGRARGPDLAPDGRTVAFAASPASAGIEGQARLDVPWNLYVMNVDERRPRPVLEGIEGSSGPRHSPDGRWLLFAGRLGDSGDGVYLLRLSDRRVVRISGDRDDRPASWSPDGREVLVIRDIREDGLTQRSELVRLDVSGVVGG
jgi:hypothetical protein